MGTALVLNISEKKEECSQGKEGGKKDMKEGRRLKEQGSTTDIIQLCVIIL